MAAIRQKIGEQMREFAMRHVRNTDGLGRAAACGNLIDVATRPRGEKNHAQLTPRSSKRGLRNLADSLRRPTGDIYFFELSDGKECDGPAVRRPERISRFIRTGENLRIQRIECSNP